VTSGGEVSLSGGCLVHWALVADLLVLRELNRVQKNARHFLEESERSALVEHSLIRVPPAAFQVQSVDVDSILRHLGDLILEEVFDFGLES